MVLTGHPVRDGKAGRTRSIILSIILNVGESSIYLLTKILTVFLDSGNTRNMNVRPSVNLFVRKKPHKVNMYLQNLVPLRKSFNTCLPYGAFYGQTD